ncbi:hypothetical protein AWC38_SpisGene8277 [Stylophora pistillata]|uniref:Uncharacterized protein n=1 Tax=Stylophora pistillata TaxID=50429 RepID=A0A2B4SDB3_STYPI|nr:hypothetical protein AWC38_SpisGene8277 [Stylophora pistillata]
MRLEEDLRPITLTSPLAKVLKGFTLEHLMSQVAEGLDSIRQIDHTCLDVYVPYKFTAGPGYAFKFRITHTYLQVFVSK